MLPWSLRNYSTFGEFVPVRTGSGQMAFTGVVAPAATLPDAPLAAAVRSEWQSDTPRSAIFQSLDTARRFSLVQFQYDYANEVAPPEYAGMNEAQRDRWMMGETMRYIMQNPALKLALAKLQVFACSMGMAGVASFVLAVPALVLVIRRHALLTLLLWAGAYTGPFLLVILLLRSLPGPGGPVAGTTGGSYPGIRIPAAPQGSLGTRPSYAGRLPGQLPV